VVAVVVVEVGLVDVEVVGVGAGGQ